MSHNKNKSADKRPLRDGIDDARSRGGDVAISTRKAAAAVIEKGRAQAASLGAVSDNPLLALVGGIAIGAVLGAMLPRTDREAQLFGALGTKLNDAARDAAGAARDAGKGKLDELGFNRDNAQNMVRSVVDAAISAVTSAGNAAVDVAKERGGVSTS